MEILRQSVLYDQLWYYLSNYPFLMQFKDFFKIQLTINQDFN